ncbi:S41 family peptidase [Larkinella soli]|uniref:S41 family peptidase n=1 Tax=Larkinella soli TaxID=1770527 RepID=UPI001E560D08|nr:S41 family peptidase [Larkinella soli]
MVRPLDPLLLVTRALDKLGHNYATKPYQAEGFQREYVTAGRSVIQLLEVAFRSSGTPQSHVSSVLDAWFVEDKAAKAPLWNPARGGFYTFGWTDVSGIQSPAQPTFLGVALSRKSALARYYTFVLRTTSYLNGKEVYLIDFDQKKNVRKPLLKGTIYIDAESSAIVKLEHQLSPYGLPFLKTHQNWGGVAISQAPKRLTVSQDRWVTTYRQFGQKWYLHSQVIETDFSAALVFMGLVQARQDSLRLHSERIVTQIDTLEGNTGAVSNLEDVGRLPTLQNFIKKEFEKEPVNWSQVNYLRADTTLTELARRLRRKNEQWERDKRIEVTRKAMTRRTYTASQVVEDLIYLQESLEKLHPGLYWYTDKPSLDRAFDQLKSALTKTTRESDLYYRLSTLIEQIHCGHTELLPSVTTHDYLSLVAKRLPLDLWITGDSTLVTQDYPGVPQGSAIVSVNGHEQVETLRRLRSVLPSDGYNQTYKSFRLQNEFSTLFARYVQPADTFEVQIREPSGSLRAVRLAGAGFPAPSRPDEFATAQVHDSLQTMVLKIPSFATTQDFPAFLQETFRTLNQRRLSSLVIDLRNNQGGRDDYGALLYAYLANQPFHYYRRISVATADSTWLNRLSVSDLPLLQVLPDYRSGIQKTDSGFLYTNHLNMGLQAPRTPGFTGTVYVLINGGTFSTAAEFAALVRSQKRGQFIGQETGGGYMGNSSLASPVLTLPHSRLRLSLPLGRYDLAVVPAGMVGRGVQPDYPVRYTLKDHLDKRDVELTRSFELIRKQNRAGASR